MSAQKDSNIYQDVSIFKEISEDEAMQMLAHNREMAEWSINGRLKAAKEEGIKQGLEQFLEQGREKGREQKAHETAVELLKMGLSLENISTVIKEVRDIKDKLSKEYGEMFSQELYERYENTTNLILERAKQKVRHIEKVTSGYSIF